MALREKKAFELKKDKNGNITQLSFRLKCNKFTSSAQKHIDALRLDVAPTFIAADLVPQPINFELMNRQTENTNKTRANIVNQLRSGGYYSIINNPIKLSTSEVMELSDALKTAKKLDTGLNFWRTRFIIDITP